MAVYYPGDCAEEIPAHVCDPCEAREKGRVSSVAFIDANYEFTDITSSAEWLAGIEAGLITVIPAVVGSFDGGSEVEGTGYGRQATSLDGYDFSANYRDPNYKSNCLHYKLLSQSRTKKFAYVTETQLHYVDEIVSVIPKAPVTEELNSDVVWDVTVKWSSKEFPCPTPIPEGIFDECFYTT